MGAILLTIKAWSFWSRLGGLFSALITWAGKNPWPALAALLLVGNVIQLVIHKRDLAQAAAIALAQKGATAAQIKVNQVPAIISAAIARQSDAQAPAYYASVAAAADAHRGVVRAAPCPVSAAGVPGPDPVTPFDDRPAPTPELVSRSKVEDDLIIAAAGRAAQMHQDALDLIADGAAVLDTPVTVEPGN